MKSHTTSEPRPQGGVTKIQILNSEGNLAKTLSQQSPVPQVTGFLTRMHRGCECESCCVCSTIHSADIVCTLLNARCLAFGNRGSSERRRHSSCPRGVCSLVGKMVTAQWGECSNSRARRPWARTQFTSWGGDKGFRGDMTLKLPLKDKQYPEAYKWVEQGWKGHASPGMHMCKQQGIKGFKGFRKQWVEMPAMGGRCHWAGGLWWDGKRPYVTAQTDLPGEQNLLRSFAKLEIPWYHPIILIP